MSLKRKLLIPFLFFAFTGTTILTLIGLTSQHSLIRKEEKDLLAHHYMHFLERLHQREMQSLSIASVIAENPEVGRMLSTKNKDSLFKYLEPTYIILHQNFQVSQFHFHISPGISFLRLHKPDKYGDMIESSRKTVSDALTKGLSSACLEKGVTGFGIRGVAPIFYEGKIIGCIDIGHSFGKAFVEDFYKSWDTNIALYDISQSGKPLLLASAGYEPLSILSDLYNKDTEKDNPVIFVSPEQFPDRSIIIGPVKDCSGNKIALIEISTDRSEIREKLAGTRNLMIAIGLAGIFISFLFTYLVIDMFIKPIREIVEEAKDIAVGKREIRLDSRPPDEIGVLADSLNIMLEALKKRRIEIENYARTLEIRVKERTRDLVASEEKYRTMVENVPLVVYRVLGDGTTEFVNSYLTESVGYTIEEAISNKRFWRDKIAGEDPDALRTIMKTCLEKKLDCRIEHPVRAKDGRLLHFITHAIPSIGEDGEVSWVDGFMLDITELKRLQEKAIQAEEIRTLGEISATMAHEIRNPLSAAGGFARRLSDALGENDPNKKMAKIIVEEVAKLERFVRVLLSSIEPFELTLSAVDLNGIINTCLNRLGPLSESRQITFIRNLEADLPKIQADQGRLGNALDDIFKHAVISTLNGETISISTASDDKIIILNMTHKVNHITDDDIEKFFFPHIERDAEESVHDLPLAKVIIHRHDGKIDITRLEDNILNIRIEFPAIEDK